MAERTYRLASKVHSHDVVRMTVEADLSHVPYTVGPPVNAASATSDASGYEPPGSGPRASYLGTVSKGPSATDIEGSELAPAGKGFVVAALIAILSVQVSGLGLQIGKVSIRSEHVLPFLLALLLLRRGRLGTNLNLIALLYIPFLWYFTVTVLGAPDVAQSFQSIVALLAATAALPCLVVLGEHVGGTRLLHLWLAGGTVVNGIGLALYATGLGGTQLDVATGHVVAEGLAYEANIYGSQAGALVIAALVLPGFTTRRSALLVPVVNACALILSQARGAWVSCALLLILMMVTRRIALRRLLVLLVIVGSTGFVLFSISQLSLRTTETQAALITHLATRAQSLTDASTGTGAYRIRTWELAMQDIREFPFAGSGIGSYASLHGDFTRPGQPGYLSNIYLGWLHDGGAIGSLLICSSLLLFVRFLGGIRVAMTNPAFLSMLMLGIAYVATDSSWIAWPWALAGVAFAHSRC